MDVTFLNYKKPKTSWLQCQKRQEFLFGMIQTYKDLSSFDEPVIFYINKDQKHILNQLILFASMNWDWRQNWCKEQWCLASRKASPKTFVNKPWKKFKLPKNNTDYVNNICAVIVGNACEVDILSKSTSFTHSKKQMITPGPF